jgi:peptide chain release factor 3
VTQQAEIIQGIANPLLDQRLGTDAAELRDEIALVHGASHAFDPQAYLAGEQTPVFFGSAINNFGVTPLLDAFVRHAPPPGSRATVGREIHADEPALTGFVFKIQANMDPAHRDRVAFMRICSGRFESGMKMYHVRLGKTVKAANALTFMAQERAHVEIAWPGDIGVCTPRHHQHRRHFTGAKRCSSPAFICAGAVRRAQLRDPLKLKALQKGLAQLSEEGATQFFRPLASNDLILGAVGILQFDVVAYRLQNEYGVEAVFENVNVTTARWIDCDDPKKLADFRRQLQNNLAEDGAGQLVYLAPSRVNLQLTQERWPDIRFKATRETTIFAG